VWKDSEKEDRTIVNHYHGVSSSVDDVLKMTTPRPKISASFRRHERSRNFQEDFVV
jgi:hypothetical protein